MPRVSQKKVQKDILLKIHRQFSEMVLDLKNTKQGVAFIEELLTDTEKAMLAKRLAVLMMLSEKVPHSTIAQLLGVTRATVLKYAKRLKRGSFTYMRNVFNQRKNREELWKTLCKLSPGSLPSYAGRGRHSYLYRQTQRR